MIRNAAYLSIAPLLCLVFTSACSDSEGDTSATGVASIGQATIGDTANGPFTDTMDMDTFGEGDTLEGGTEGANGEQGGPGNEEEQGWPNNNIDILFVVDNSGSMGEEQAFLTSAIPDFISQLEGPDIDANYRIAVTTTDMGRNLYGWCPQSGPMVRGNQGSFMLTSCLDRLNEDFVRGGYDADLDMRYIACQQSCEFTTAEINVSATTTETDAVAKSRPWIERIDGKTNLDGEASVAEALACFLPTGINGCGFEMQLESTTRAIEKTQDPQRPEYGFMRDDAHLLVVYITDEADCSAQMESIFDPDGDLVFWNADETPTSHICWNAGVECSGDDCKAVNRDEYGTPEATDEDAVLHPMSRYRDQLEKILEHKKSLNPGNKVMVTLIAGVRGNGSSATVHYPNVRESDPTFHSKFGIGKGCSFSYEAPSDSSEPTRGPLEQFAIPPVRLRELSEHMTENGMFTICQSDFSAPLSDIASRLRNQ